ncbi:MAG TPA: DivIVA domain-containing protein [Actinomycetota bacterium]|nr:DivIVA domain-containing protein [Actinomycetota bacterium]
MSTADLELFGPPDSDGSPRFTQVLRGYDPEQVRGYFLQLSARIDTLERELDDAVSQRDAARRRYSMAKDDAYGQLASRMADLLRVADQQAEKIRRDAEEEARHRVDEARHLAAQIQRESEGEAERLRQQALDVLRKAETDRDRVLGGLTASRDAVVAELQATREHMVTVIQQLEVAMAVAQAAYPTEGIEDLSEGDGTGEDPQADDLLGRTEGFEIMIPQFIGGEQPEAQTEQEEEETS